MFRYSFLLFIVFATIETYGDLWINEFHYDNVGGDVNEFVELVVTSDVMNNRDDYLLSFYNGSDSEVYKTISLDSSNFMSNAENNVKDYSFLYAEISGIQNGAPDGLCLSDTDSNIYQFISYEGGLTASGGPADGMISTDIGVSESSSTDSSFSMQLVGNGWNYASFSWDKPKKNTMGKVNTGQTFTAVPEPSSAFCLLMALVLFANLRKKPCR